MFLVALVGGGMVAYTLVVWTMGYLTASIAWQPVRGETFRLPTHHHFAGYPGPARRPRLDGSRLVPNG